VSSEKSLATCTGIHEHYNTCCNRIAEHASLLTMVEFSSCGRTKKILCTPNSAENLSGCMFSSTFSSNCFSVLFSILTLAIALETFVFSAAQTGGQ